MFANLKPVFITSYSADCMSRFPEPLPNRTMFFSGQNGILLGSRVSTCEMSFVITETSRHIKPALP